MIHAISGKPGGGKTLYSVRLIVHELVYGSRTVITNVAIKAPELNEYIQREFPKASVNLFDRLWIFSEDEIKKFFTIRPRGSVGPKLLTKDQWKNGELPDYSGVNDNGVLYVIDETHIGFNARNWQETGQDALYYLSQHRKLNDTVVWITQAIANVDKQFRSVTQDFTYIRNLSKEKMGLFRLPAIFTRQTYTEPATSTSRPMETGTFRLDVAGLAACYDTAKGVGIHGALADQGEKRNGLSWMWFVVGLPVLLIAIYLFLPKLGAKLFSSPMHQPRPSQTTNTPSVVPVATIPKELNYASNKLEQIEKSFHMETNQVKVATVDRLAGYWRISLTDGRWIHEIVETDNLQKITSDYIIAGGIRYPYASPPTGSFRLYEAPASGYVPVTYPPASATVTVIGTRPSEGVPSSREVMRNYGGIY